MCTAGGDLEGPHHGRRGSVEMPSGGGRAMSPTVSGGGGGSAGGISHGGGGGGGSVTSGLDANAGPRIFVGKLNRATTEADVREYFTRCVCFLSWPHAEPAISTKGHAASCGTLALLCRLCDLLPHLLPQVWLCHGRVHAARQAQPARAPRLWLRHLRDGGRCAPCCCPRPAPDSSKSVP